MSKTTISTFQLFELFPDEEAARKYLEDRLWPKGPVCPDCKSGERVSALGTCMEALRSQAPRPCVEFCQECNEPIIDGQSYEAAIADLREQLTDSGYEEQTEDHEREARAAYEAAPKPRTEICQECNEPIIDGQASCHKMGCKSNQEIEF